ncbi:polyphosphate kinase 2 [Raoultella planticola]|uniref:Polyphosphate kinase 2 n=1 Tax=Raoultella planticola TaxID=575 RepID=A0A485A966_RAOPL|nr:polyphosphate kinase 2 [Raoultella planticola]
MCIVFEGRDGAGKGGTIQSDHRAGQSARIPGDRPAGPDRQGEDPSSIFNAISRICRPLAKSLFSTAAGITGRGVERVMGFCSADDVEKFLAGRRW